MNLSQLSRETECLSGCVASQSPAVDHAPKNAPQFQRTRRPPVSPVVVRDASSRRVARGYLRRGLAKLCTRQQPTVELRDCDSALRTHGRGPHLGTPQENEAELPWRQSCLGRWWPVEFATQVPVRPPLRSVRIVLGKANPRSDVLVVGPGSIDLMRRAW